MDWKLTNPLFFKQISVCCYEARIIRAKGKRYFKKYVSITLGGKEPKSDWSVAPIESKLDHVCLGLNYKEEEFYIGIQNIDDAWGPFEVPASRKIMILIEAYNDSSKAENRNVKCFIDEHLIWEFSDPLLADKDIATSAIINLADYIGDEKTYKLRVLSDCDRYNIIGFGKCDKNNYTFKGINVYKATDKPETTPR